MARWRVDRAGPQWLLDPEGRLAGYVDIRGNVYPIPQVAPIGAIALLGDDPVQALTDDEIDQVRGALGGIGATGGIIGSPDGNGNVIFSLDPATDGGVRDLSYRKAWPRGRQDTIANVQWGTGVGANSTPTATSIAGTDMDFDIAFTTSATPASQQAIVFVPWSGGNGMFTVAPLVDVVSQSRTVATPLQATQGGIVLAQGGTNGITISSGTVALSASTAYKLRIHVYPQGA